MKYKYNTVHWHEAHIWLNQTTLQTQWWKRSYLDNCKTTYDGLASNWKTQNYFNQVEMLSIVHRILRDGNKLINDHTHTHTHFFFEIRQGIQSPQHGRRVWPPTNPTGPVAPPWEFPTTEWGKSRAEARGRNMSTKGLEPKPLGERTQDTCN